MGVELTEKTMFGLTRSVRGVISRNLATSATLSGAYPKNGGLTHDQRVKAWCDYFDHEECDYWYFRHAARKCMGDDWIPPPQVVQSMLSTAKRTIATQALSESSRW